jgi:hypothetical protein
VTRRNSRLDRGVSLAFAHAQQLVSTIDSGDSPTEFGMAFDQWTDANVASWYPLQAGADASIVRRMQAAVRGEELPPPDRMEQVRSVMIELSKQPSPAGLRLRRMRNLGSMPSEVLADPTVLAAANDFLAQQREQNGALAGPTRAAFAVSCASGKPTSSAATASISS